MNWSAPLEFTPVPTPDGRRLVTLDDARRYLLKHHPEAEYAAGALLKAAKAPNQLYCLCARSAVYKAIYGDKPKQRERKETWREKRRARRG